MVKSFAKKIRNVLTKNLFLKNIVMYFENKKKFKSNKKIAENIKVEEKTIIFASFYGKKYACSPKAIYEYLLTAPGFEDYEFIWAFGNPKARKYKEDPRTRIVKYYTPEFYSALAKAKYWIFNFKTPEYFYKKPEQIFVQCWHGTPLKKIGCDIEVKGSKAQSLGSMHKAYIKDAQKYDYFISPSKFSSEKFVSAFGLNSLNKSDIIIETGYPRNDALRNVAPEKVAKIKEEFNIPTDKKVILYAPTFRDSQYSTKKGFTYKLGINLKNLKDTLPDEYVIILRLHYLVSNKIDVSEFEGFVYDFSNLDDINDLYLISDMLITDYSSVFFDYANLKRPILFYMYDLEEYKGSIRDFYIDLKELPGPIYETEEELIGGIRNIDSIKVEYNETYEIFNSKFNYLEDGNAASRVVGEIICL